MNYSVDDLVSSLSSSHIGQEAIDLATLQVCILSVSLHWQACSPPSGVFGFFLQVQLAATLFPARASCSSTSCSSQHCNSPLARTPSHNFSMNIDMTTAMRTTVSSRRGSYSMPHHHHTYNTYVKNEPSISCAHHHNYISDTMEEDERMVEELLLPSPNPASNSVPTTSSFTPSHPHAHLPPPSSCTPSNTLFTTTDPFYLSQLQNSQQAFAPNPAVPQSIFAQNGKISQGSRFALQSATF